MPLKTAATACFSRLFPTAALLLALSFSYTPTLHAQPRVGRIQAQYHLTPLEEILRDLNKRYGLRFAYSPTYIPLHQTITLTLPGTPLAEAMNLLFDPLPIRYQFVGEQIVLRYSPKTDPLALRRTELPDEVPQQTPLYADARREALREERQKKIAEELPALTKRLEYQGGIQSTRPDSAAGDLNAYLTTPVAPASPTRLAQISLLPYLGSGVLEGYRAANRLSVNLLWGLNGGVNGLEIGGLANHILHDVKGIQIAGIFNIVDDDLTGIQFAGLANDVSDTLYGVQISGLLNRAGKAYSVQSAGLLNIARYDFSGIQASAALNYCGGASTGIQVAGLGNIAKGSLKLQVGSLFNVAEEVENGQFSALYNRAKSGGKFQIGLLNYADTLSGIPIGLFSFVKKGYHRLEIGTSETFHTNIALRVGVNRFYNIFFLGGRAYEGPDDSQALGLGWGLGYGLGTMVKNRPHGQLYVELISAHVNEQSLWTRELNQLQQLRVNWEYSIGKQVGLYFGPTINMLVSRRKDPETGIVATNFPPYRWIGSRPGAATSVQCWGGLALGVRFW